MISSNLYQSSYLNELNSTLKMKFGITVETSLFLLKFYFFIDRFDFKQTLYFKVFVFFKIFILKIILLKI